MNFLRECDSNGSADRSGTYWTAEGRELGVAFDIRSMIIRRRAVFLDDHTVEGSARPGSEVRIVENDGAILS